ncbi:MAG: ribonuclease III domain-containing protein [Vampirovibrionales bacterium]|nr:ribonuclease III domain-containing protein [Vampirovibrionales bacterium]
MSCFNVANVPHPRVLAMVGDAAYELWLCEHVVQHAPNMRANKLHQWLIQHACGAFQAKLLEVLTPLLNEAEQDLIRRARNVPLTASRRNDRLTTQQATAFEALVGWLHLSQPERLAALLASAVPLLAPITD